jgi:uroporphyrinogen-III decarboxylase
MAEMTGTERYLACLHGQTPDKVPILHWSTDLCQSLSGVPMYEYAYDPEKMALGFIRYVESYKPDITSIGYDLWNQLEPYGVEVYITDKLIYPKKTLADRNRPDPKVYEELEYRSPFAGKRTQIYGRAHDIVLEELGDKVAIRRGAYGAPSNLALLMGVKETLRDLILFPEAVFAAIERVMLDWTLDYATGLIEPFKDKLETFTFGFASLDADLLPPEHTEEIARLEVESLDRIREQLRKMVGRDLPITTHICGARPNLDLITEKFGDRIDELQYWAGSDYGSDYPLEDAVTNLGDRYVISSGIDHTRTLLLGSTEEVETMVKSAMDIAKDRCRFVLASGCELGIGPPEANLTAVVEARDKYGTY